jgi:hypothetical protein
VFAIVKKFLSSLVKSFPIIEPIEFSDGLLAFRCENRLPFELVTVASLTSQGSVLTKVEICSYDTNQQLYRAHLGADCAEETLQRLELPARSALRLTQALRVSSRQIPKFFALTEDISSSGLRLATPDKLPVGSNMDISMDLDDPAVPTIQVKGEVCWTAMKADGSYHSGVRFVGIDRGQFRMLERYIESRLATHRTVHGDG